MEGNRHSDPQQYLPLVKKIVDRIDVKLPEHWDKEDMIGYGVLGLMEAIQRFQPGKGVKFSTFASLRIKGAILDALRRDSPLSRGRWETVRRIAEAIERLSQSTDLEFSLDTIAKELNISKSDVTEALDSVKLLSHLSLEQTLNLDDSNEIKIRDTLTISTDLPEETVIKKEQISRLSKAINELEERQRLVLTLYYYEELTMKEIAKVLNITVSRVSQIKTLALVALRKKLEDR